MLKKQRIQTCSMCDQMTENKCLSKCSHIVCTDCITTYLKTQSNNKKRQTIITCPCDKCHSKIYIQELLKITMMPATEINACKKCKVPVPYTCGPCLVKDIEEIAKTNFYSKQLKFDQLIPLEQQEEVIEEIKKYELICPVCKDFNQIPVIVCLRGHEICRDCFYNIRSFDDVKQSCPICKSDLLSTPPDSLRALNQIKELSIKCPTCSQMIKYTEFIQYHFRKCCEILTECNGCQQQIEIRFYDIHVDNYCPQSICPFNCDRKLSDHNQNFLMEHLMSTMRQSDVAHTFMLRMQVIEKFLFYGSFGLCPLCDYQFAWQLEIKGIQETFCFRCFKLT